MIKEFINWMTYNPNEIEIEIVIRPLVIIILSLFIVLFAVVSLIKRIKSLKSFFENILVSIILTLYMIISFLWSLCFYERWESYVIIIPPILYLIIVKAFRYRANLKERNKKEGWN